MKKLREVFNVIQNYFSGMFISVKFIYLLLSIFFILLTLTMLFGNTASDDNVIVLRTAFSSLMGYVLENSTRKYICTDKGNQYKIFIVGSIALGITFIVFLSYVLRIDYYNPTLILFKNILFSCIGFLISTAKDCD